MRTEPIRMFGEWLRALVAALLVVFALLLHNSLAPDSAAFSTLPAETVNIRHPARAATSQSRSGDSRIQTQFSADGFDALGLAGKALCAEERALFAVGNRRLVQARAEEQHIPKAFPPSQPARPHDEVRSCIAYKEEKRISLPETLVAGWECHAAAYQADLEDLILFDVPAWLCFSCNGGNRARICFEARSEGYGHQFVSDLEMVPVFPDRQPRQAVLFSATFSGGGSGASRLLTLWVYRKECGQYVNIMPEITITNLGEFKLLRKREDGCDGVLAIADYVYGPGELHYSPHKYRIKLYRYSDKEKKFRFVPDSVFVTTTKYYFEDRTPTEAIDDHLEKIGELLKLTCGKTRTP